MIAIGPRETVRLATTRRVSGPRRPSTTSARATLPPMHSRSSFTLALISFVALAACEKKDTAVPGAAPDIVVPPATFAASVDAPKVIEECDLQNRLPGYLAEAAPNTGPGAATAGKVLTLEISHVMGFGGGLYSGPKQIVVKGTLTEGGAVTGTFEAKRTTVTGGAFGAYKGTCSLLHRTAKAVAKDVSGWLPAPTMNAKLGEM